MARPSAFPGPRAGAPTPTAPIEVEVGGDVGGDDFAQILPLLEAVYPGRLDREIWRWQYSGHYLGPPRVAIARSGGRIVGLQPSIRHEAWWPGGRALAYELCHVLTHPEHRRRGIFTALIRAFARHAEEEGACCVYTFPNRLSYPGFRRAGSWEHPFSLPLLIRLAAGSGRRRRWPAGRPEGQPIERFDAGVDALGAALLERFPAGMVRDHRYLNWRYLEHPRRPYVCLALRDGPRWRAVAIGRLVEWFGVRVGAIVELLGDPGSLEPLLVGLEEALVRRGARALGCLMLPGRGEAGLLQRLGYRRLPAWAVRKEFFFVVRAPGGLPDGLRWPAGWWLSWGDIDSV